jgi:endo-1,4-beta-D-glucanase Y
MFAYPSDVILPSGGQAALDTATSQAYDTWKGKYVQQACGGYFVISGGGTGAGVGNEVSEGHGYGMVITAMMAGYDANAKTVFDGMLAMVKKYPSSSHKNLMTWTLDTTKNCAIPAMAGNDSATDGDLDIAYSLLLAEEQWPGNGYLATAQAMIADVVNGDVNAGTHLTTLGDWSTSSDPMYNGTRPSDFMLDHFRAFGRATGDASWQTTVDSTYSLIATIQQKFSPMTGLLPDFVVNTNAAPQPAPANWLESANDGNYYYNSCRTPWRMATDYIASGDMRAKTAVTGINSWIVGATNGMPSSIVDGYTLAGGSIGTGASSAFSSPFAVAAMLSGNQQWLDALWSSRAITEDYFADTITMYAMLVMSGNWWPPC